MHCQDEYPEVSPVILPFLELEDLYMPMRASLASHIQLNQANLNAFDAINCCPDILR